MRTEDPFAWRHEDDLVRLMAVLNEDGEARYVGGCVRDSLLGAPPGGPSGTDIDIATTHLPEDVQNRLGKSKIRTIPTGIEHGTVTAVLKGRPIEITTLRADVATDGRHAEVRFTTDFGEDARRRDFTMNALYLGADGTLFDPEGGQADLRARRVRFIGDPAARITEDYLRILRFLRFTARFGSALDPVGWQACVDHRDGLDRLSKERIWHELRRTFPAAGAPMVLAQADHDGVLGEIVAAAADPDRLARAHGRLGGIVEPALGLVALWPGAGRAMLRAAFKPPTAVLDGVEAILQAERLLQEGAGLHVLLYRTGREATLGALAMTPGPDPDDLERVRAARVPVLPLRGQDFIDHGLPSGPAVGEAMRRFEALWLSEGCPSDPGAVRRLRDRASTGGPA